MKSMLHALAFATLFLLAAGTASAHQFYEKLPPGSFTQPSYQTFHASMWGPDYALEQETSDGYQIVPNWVDGYWYYAQLSTSGEYEPSPYKVAIDTPPTTALHLRRSSTRVAAIEAELAQEEEDLQDAFEEYMQVSRDDPLDYKIGVHRRFHRQLLQKQTFQDRQTRPHLR